MSNTVTCSCQTCSGSIEFSSEHEGQTAPCPHCGIDTLLYNPNPQKPPPIQIAPSPVTPKTPLISVRWILLIIACCIAMVFGIIGAIGSQAPDEDGKPSGTPMIMGFLSGILVFALCAGGLAVYFLPLIIASVKHKKNVVAIGLLNLFIGWTFIGWVISIVWAATED